MESVTLIPSKSVATAFKILKIINEKFVGIQIKLDGGLYSIPNKSGKTAQPLNGRTAVIGCSS